MRPIPQFWGRYKQISLTWLRKAKYYLLQHASAAKAYAPAAGVYIASIYCILRQFILPIAIGCQSINCQSTLYLSSGAHLKCGTAAFEHKRQKRRSFVPSHNYALVTDGHIF